MPSTELLLAFFATTALFAYIPGPAMLYAAAQTLAGGRWSGLMASLGIHVGGYAHVFAAAAGLSVLFHAVPLLYMAVKLFGAAYLVWLGICLFRAKAAGETDLPATPGKSGWRAFIESITVEVLNPKTALFFLAFLPQFVHPGHGSAVAQFATLGLIFVAMSAAYTSLLALAAGQISPWIRRHRRIGQWQGRVVGTIYIALGIRLAFQER